MLLHRAKQPDIASEDQHNWRAWCLCDWFRASGPGKPCEKPCHVCQMGGLSEGLPSGDQTEGMSKQS